MPYPLTTVLPQPIKSSVRQTVDSVKRLWTSSPIAEYWDHRLTDVYLVSYPRSGRTWLRTMVGTALCQQFELAIATPEKIADLWKLEPQIPVIRLSHQDIRLPHPDKFRNKKVILLVRNPLDIGVSHYHYRQRGEDLVNRVTTSVNEAVTSYNKWAAFMAQHPSCLVVKYEDLLTTSETCLQDIFRFLDLPQVCEGTTLADTVEACSFQNLKQLAHDPTRSLFYRPHTSEMVRSGKSGSSKEELNPETYDELKQFVRTALSPTFRYDLDA